MMAARSVSGMTGKLLKALYHKSISCQGLMGDKVFVCKQLHCQIRIAGDNRGQQVTKKLAKKTEFQNFMRQVAMNGQGFGLNEFQYAVYRMRNWFILSYSVGLNCRKVFW
jgi:hypothetical protein